MSEWGRARPAPSCAANRCTALKNSNDSEKGHEEDDEETEDEDEG